MTRVPLAAIACLALVGAGCRFGARTGGDANATTSVKEDIQVDAILKDGDADLEGAKDADFGDDMIEDLDAEASASSTIDADVKAMDDGMKDADSADFSADVLTTTSLKY